MQRWLLSADALMCRVANQKSSYLPWFVLALLVLFIGCQNDDLSSTEDGDSTLGDGGRLKVVATVGMVADVVREIGGERIELAQLMGPGVDPHLYKATRDDVQQIMTADLVFTNGLMLEGRLEDTFNRIAQKKPVFAMTRDLPQDLLLKPDGAGDHPDPHVWMDVAAWANCLDVITEGLSKSLPEHAPEFQTRSVEYRKALQALHEYGLSAIGSIPESSRVLVTSHDAFNYFGRAYNMEVLGVQGLSTESEAGLQRINELVDLLVERKVPAVFVESSVPQKNILALIDGAKSRGHDVKVGGELFSDAMGAAGTYEGTYLGMLDHNITTVARALGGTAPERGLSGKLMLPKDQP